MLLVTGGAGYIGSVIAAHAQQKGHHVRIFDRQKPPFPAESWGIHFAEGDLRDAKVVRAALDGVTAVIHCAALSLVQESVIEPSRYWINNVLGTRVLLDEMARVGIDRLVNSSTAAVYGISGAPALSENSPVHPTNPYGSTKAAVELMISDASRSVGLSATSLRYFNVAGASRKEGVLLGERHDPETHLIPNAISAAMQSDQELILNGTDWPTSDGTNVRDYVHVEDLAAAHVTAIDREPTAEHHVINLGSGRGYSNREVISTVEEVTGKSIRLSIGPRRDGDPPSLIAAIDRAAERLNWRPQRNLEVMVQDAFDFARSAR